MLETDIENDVNDICCLLLDSNENSKVEAVSMNIQDISWYHWKNKNDDDR
jgi:hypothetical protein